MKWFLNLTTRTKLFLSFGLLIVSMAIVGIVAYIGITTIQESQRRIFEQDFADVADLKDIRYDQSGTRSDLLVMLSTVTPSDAELLRNTIEERSKRNSARLQKLLERNTGQSEFLSTLKEFGTVRTSFNRTREEQVLPLMHERRFEEAKRLIFGIQAEQNAKLESLARDLVESAENDAQKAVALAEETASESVRIFLTVGIIALVLAVAMTMYLSRIIAAPLKEITAVAGKIAAGDLTITISSDDTRTDEVGSLRGTFGRMTENLRTVMGEILEGINVLAGSATEILASTTQVSSGAAETATAISQTTTTVEEVKQTAQLSSQKAKYVSDSSQKTAQISQNGKQAVEESVKGMNRIREQMATVADSIVKLSEQSQAIGDIITTVNDLAEQSNLLAVNAAIEAAKAGEQGKGFAVVAQEVKSLAERSKQSTAQVRAILLEIQKATAGAVMATEQGSKAVEAGANQSAQAGESIRALTESISESAQAATQIAASSQQQLVGMDQVALAMESIKQASAQNVSSTKQVETAARNLNDLGQKLKGMVEAYRL